MEITVTSRHTIKPSSPTPHHLRHLQLSLFDQYMGRHHIQVLFFYSSGGDLNRFESTGISAILRKSLSVVLTEFYPLAGEVGNNHLIHCNDRGLEYIEARVHAPLTLTQLLTSPQAEELKNFFFSYDPDSPQLSGVQVTVFDGCGSMAIGVGLSHRLADGSSLGTFVNRWAAIARGDSTMHDNTSSPIFGFSTLFPPRDIPPALKIDAEAGRPQIPIVVTKRFVFDQMKIDALKAAHFVYTNPTRVEVVSTLLFKCLITVSNCKSSKSVGIGTAVNLRSRTSPPLPAHHFGNLALPLTLRNIGSNSTLNDIRVQFRKSIKDIDTDILQKLQADNGLLLRKILERGMVSNDIRNFELSSWCKFPLYQVDVGWGEPTWAASFYLNYPDVIKIVDAKNGDGIEAWVTLDEDDMVRFECLEELVQFSTPNPSIPC